MSAEDNSHRKRNNYKLLVDPELQKGKKKLYRLNGAIPGKPPIPDPKDPRVQKTVLGLGGSDLELPVPRFKYDRFWVNEPPERDVLVTGLDESQQIILKEACEDIGPVQSIKFHKNPKTRIFMGIVSLSYSKAGDGKKAVSNLNGKTIGGSPVIMTIDDKGEHLKAHLDPIVKDTRRTSTDIKPKEQTTITNKILNIEKEKLVNCNEGKSKDELQGSTGNQFYPFSSLSLTSNSTPSVGESPSSGFLSPGLTPHTPSSIDSGISLRPFDPLLALRSSLGQPSTSKIPSSGAPPLPPDDRKSPLPPPPPTKEEGIENISSEEEEEDKPKHPKINLVTKISIPLSPPTANQVTDPRLNSLTGTKPYEASDLVVGVASNTRYDIEVEEISGDESPVMVYSTQLELEEISSDEEEGQQGSDDMDISDEDMSQNESLIEVNIQPTTKTYPCYPTPPAIPPPLPPIPLTYHHIPPGYYPKPPYLPSDIYPPPSLHQHVYPTAMNGYPEDNYKYSFSSYPNTKFTPTKQWKVPSANNRKERQGQNVLYRALEQLSRILLKDLEKKLVESSAYPVLDGFWEKREDKKVNSVSTMDNTDVVEAESHVKAPEPYRRMLPGLVPSREDGNEETVVTPRKRLMNFKIPFVVNRQRRDAVMVARRRLYDDDRERDGRRRRKRRRREDSSPQRHQISRSQLSILSDISSDELSSEKDGDDDSEYEWRKRSRKIPSSGPRTPPESSTEEEEEEEEEDEIGESDIFGSSSSSDYEEEERRRRQKVSARKRGRSRRWSSSNISEVMDTKFDETQNDSTLITPSLSPLAQPVEEKEVKKEALYSKRIPKTEETILGEFLKEGPDKEDVLMMRLALSRLKREGADLATDVPWAYYPPAVKSLPPIKRRRLQEELHPTGCARSEGYYKIDARDKTRYLPHLRRSKGNQTNQKEGKPASSGRGNRLNHRRVASLFTSGDISKELQQYNQLKTRNKQLRFAKSTIHNWGLFALESISADEMVVEYVGQVVRQVVADERERRYEAQGIGSSYLFRVDFDYIIDATKSGNHARFINHCCDPNCYAKVITIGTQKKIIIYSKRDIHASEEITYDYKFPIEDEKIPCLCGAPQCRGTLN